MQQYAEASDEYLDGTWHVARHVRRCCVGPAP